MEMSDDEILENDVEFSVLRFENKSRDLNLDAKVELSEADKADFKLRPSAPGQEENSPSEDTPKDEPEVPLYEDKLAESDEILAGPRLNSRAETRPSEQQLAVTDEYLESIKQNDEAPMSSSRAKGGGKWKKRRRRNPFISFFLSMYSRRPRQRVTDVARQAGRHWGRMSDSQRKLYADLHGFQT